jgi:hypothetical protein
MAQLDEHPTVKQFRERAAAGNAPVPLKILDTAWASQGLSRRGADDVGFVEIGRPEIGDQTTQVFVRRTENGGIYCHCRASAKTGTHGGIRSHLRRNIRAKELSHKNAYIARRRSCR